MLLALELGVDHVVVRLDISGGSGAVGVVAVAGRAAGAVGLLVQDFRQRVGRLLKLIGRSLDAVGVVTFQRGLDICNRALDFGLLIADQALGRVDNWSAWLRASAFSRRAESSAA